jgi:hypothetical protein
VFLGSQKQADQMITTVVSAKLLKKLLAAHVQQFLWPLKKSNLNQIGTVA